MTSWTPDLMSGRPAGEPGLLRNFVDGRFVPEGKRFAKVSPVTGETVFEVAEAGAGHRRRGGPGAPAGRCAGRGAAWTSANARRS